MYIKKLKLENFRNYEDFEIEFAPEGCLIHGMNGLGKTNLLEAIGYFAFGKSFQTGSDLDLINFSKAFFRIEGTFHLNDQDLQFSAACDNKKKIVTIDNAKLSRISELYKYVKVVYFSNNDINMIEGGPSLRRNFFDQAISQSSFAYMDLLRKFHRILKQRNALLKDHFEESEKAAWDEQFVEISAEIVEARLEYLERFIPVLQDCYFTISGEKENLSVRYESSINLDRGYKEGLQQQLIKQKRNEIRLQRTLAGPHLDDVDFYIDGKLARKFGSQGQKRSLAIASRLVQATLIQNTLHQTPILMFDDVLADLDKQRTHQIMELMSGKHQIFIATPNLAAYEDFKLVKIDLEKLK